MKKILICTLSSDEYSKSRYELINMFIQEKFDICLVSPDTFSPRDYFNYKFIKHIRIKIDRNSINPIYDIITYLKIKKLIKKYFPDLVYSFSGAKAVIYTSLAAWNVCKDKTKIFSMINGLGSLYYNNDIKYIVIRKVMNFMYKNSLKYCKMIFFQNIDDLNRFVKYNIVKRGKSTVINGAGVNLELFPFTPIENNKNCLFVGRLLRDKGIYEFVEAARIIKKEILDAKFIIVGEFDSNPMSIKKSDIKMWEKEGIIEYLGKRNDIYNLYASCRVFILPSYHEGTPRTILEALSVGRPIITTNASGCKNTVIHNENGYIVPIGSYKSIAEHIYSLINNFELCKNMGKKSRKIAEQIYDVNIINNKLKDQMLKNK
jgi:glycosyltransferase involved in cell wall biosynthesis